MYDVAIIGCGVIGAAVAHALARVQLKTIILEKENDVGDVTTKANSGIIHAGYDSKPGTRMAELNVRGSAMMEELCQNLSVPYKRIGSLVLAFDERDWGTLERLYKQAQTNGVPGVELLDAAAVREKEPQISDSVVGALYAPTAAVVDPWQLCIAMAENAVTNGAELRLDCPVSAIRKTGSGYVLTTPNGEVEARFVVNAAGLRADEVHNMAANPSFTIRPNKGEYYLLDKSQGALVNHVVFQCPTEAGKGVLVAPTVHGNLIVGPNAQDVDCVEDVANTQEGLDFVRSSALKSVPCIGFRESIRNFAGLRAHSNQDDFIISEADGFVDLAGICSPGLSSAPAIGEACVGLLEDCGLAMSGKEQWVSTRYQVHFKELPAEEKRKLIENNPLYGRIICRCETVTEGEIMDALHSPIPPRTLDGVKKRCNAGLGRCQGGFCGPRVQEMIGRELGIPMEEVLQGKAGSYIITGRTKGGN